MRPQIALLLVFAAALAAGSARAAPQGPPPPASAAALAGGERCAACHDDEAASLAGGPHTGPPGGGAAVGAAADASCTPCHGDPTAHLEVGGGRGNLFGFGDDRAAGAKTARCQSCHGAALPRFGAGPHAAAGVDCTGCHRIHGEAGSGDRALLAGGGAAALPVEAHPGGGPSPVCRGCHLEVFTQFQFNERHRLRAGVLDCTSCHDPHGAGARGRLGGFDREPCASCHADRDGPFVFEHGAQTVDGCVACHSPHGSPNRHLLTFQSTAALCFSCHAAVPGFHARFTLDTVCTHCHAAIHGSNLDPWLLQ